MKSKMNIKSIVIMAAVGIISLFFINMSLAANTAKIKVETANLRETADEGATIVEQFSLNEQVEILEKQGNWYKVKAKGLTGYIREDLLEVSKEVEQENTTNNTNNETSQEENKTTNTENTTSEEANEQKQEETTAVTSVEIEEVQLGKKKIAEDTKLKIVPVINATDIMEIKKDQEVNVIEIINEWACIEVGTTKGWVRLDKIQKEEKEEQPTTEPDKEEPEQPTTTEQPAVEPEKVLKTLFVSATSVNLREKASTSSDVVGSFPINTAVDVYAEENGWSKVKVGGKEGYILSTYLSANKQTTSRSSGARSTAVETQAQQTEAQTSSAEKAQTSNTASTQTQNSTSSKGAEVVAYAKQFIGTKYTYGGSSPSTGFDCSGFTSYVYKHFGVNLPRTSGGQGTVGTAVSRNNLQAGDLVIYSGHVAIYVGGGQVIHAPKPGKTVCIVSLEQAKPGAYQGARRIF